MPPARAAMSCVAMPPCCSTLAHLMVALPARGAPQRQTANLSVSFTSTNNQPRRAFATSPRGSPTEALQRSISRVHANRSDPGFTNLHFRCWGCACESTDSQRRPARSDHRAEIAASVLLQFAVATMPCRQPLFHRPRNGDALGIEVAGDALRHLWKFFHR